MKTAKIINKNLIKKCSKFISKINFKAGLL